jgi:hypothetical protein
MTGDGGGGGGAEGDARQGREEGNPADLVEQPAKVMRIGSMIKNLLDEVRNAPWTRPAGFGWPRSTAAPSTNSRTGWPPSSSPSSTGSRCRSGRERPATPSCGSPRRNWSAGSRVSSTASRPRWSPSRWPRSSSWPGCGARCRRVTPRPARSAPVCRVVSLPAPLASAANKATPARPVNTCSTLRPGHSPLAPGQPQPAPAGPGPRPGRARIHHTHRRLRGPKPPTAPNSSHPPTISRPQAADRPEFITPADDFEDRPPDRPEFITPTDDLSPTAQRPPPRPVQGLRPST